MALLNQNVYKIYDPLPEFDESYELDAEGVIDFAHSEVEFTDYPFTKFKHVQDAIDFLIAYGFEVSNKNRKYNGLGINVSSYLDLYTKNKGVELKWLRMKKNIQN